MDSVLSSLDSFLERSEPYAASLFSLLNDGREKVNASCSGLEAWQLICIAVVGTWLSVKVKAKLTSRADESIWQRIYAFAFRCLVKVPVISGIASKEVDKVTFALMKELSEPFKGQAFCVNLPDKGLGAEKVMTEVQRYQDMSTVRWKQGRVSGTVYADYTNTEFTGLMTAVYGLTGYTNPLHADVFPGIRKMEAEIVRMVCNLFKGGPQTCGCITTGGTESIVLACKAYRDYARSEKGITEPEMVVPSTAHAAFDKAGQMLNIRVIHIPVDPKTCTVTVNAMKKGINSRTIMLVGSTPSYPHGVIDPIADIAKLGLKYNIPVHMDACLGGFLVPFMKDAGYVIPECSFALQGVTSISADTHKYGYAPKGSSALLYSDVKYRHHQYSVQTDWPGGVYASPTISGSRAGGTIATCWASMMYNGYQGYLNSTKRIIETTRRLRKDLTQVEGLFVYGDPLMSVIAFGSDRFNILEMSDALAKRGWSLNTLQFPAGFHICVTLMHTLKGVAEDLVKDITEVAASLKGKPKGKLTGQAAVYGMAQSIPDRSMISSFGKQFLDGYYTTDWEQFKE